MASAVFDKNRVGGICGFCPMNLFEIYWLSKTGQTAFKSVDKNQVGGIRGFCHRILFVFGNRGSTAFAAFYKNRVGGICGFCSVNLFELC